MGSSISQTYLFMTVQKKTLLNSALLTLILNSSFKLCKIKKDKNMVFSALTGTNLTSSYGEGLLQLMTFKIWISQQYHANYFCQISVLMRIRFTLNALEIKKSNKSIQDQSGFTCQSMIKSSIRQSITRSQFDTSLELSAIKSRQTFRYGQSSSSKVN